MDNLDDSENNGKVSDSAYSTSCSNSQSRRSHSFKSTHSGSNSSGSSGYGGNPTSTYRVEGGRHKDKEMKKKSSVKSAKDELLCSEPMAERMLGCDPPEDRKEFEALQEEKNKVALVPLATVSQAGQAVHSMEICNIEDKLDDGSSKALLLAMNLQQLHSNNNNLDSFSFVISIYDAVVMYTSSSITTLLGYPKDMWVGRSFLEFIHSRDRNIFASQITNGLAMPKIGLKATAQVSTCTTMVCRIRRYKELNNGFDVKDRTTKYIPILLKLSFKRMNEDESDCIYLVIQATPFNSAFKRPSEILTKPIPFVIRHAANGNIEYVDLESVPYLGYLPQDLVNKNAFEMYHPADLEYLEKVYENIVREGAVSRCSLYRMMTQNGDYVKVETEWTSFINPWSKKLEFVISKHYIVEGPTNPDVFQIPESDKLKLSECDKVKRKSMMDNIMKIMNDVLTKAAEIAKYQKVKRCQELADFMETQMEPSSSSDEGNKQESDNAHGDTTSQEKSNQSSGFAPQADGWKENTFEGRFDITPEEKEPTRAIQEQTPVMLGGISPHDEFNDSKSSSESPLSYNQLNYNENLQRYFDSHKPYQNEQVNTSFDGVYYGLKDMTGYTGCQSPSPTPDEQADASTPMDTDCEPIRLTETLLNRHNAVMEKELVKMHRENRTDTRLERNKRSIENRRKKKEHLARCKATFRPTPPSAAAFNPDLYTIQHGVKRSLTMESDTIPRKQQCTHDWPVGSGATQPPSTGQTAYAPSALAGSDMNSFALGMENQHISITTPITTVPAMLPVYYTPATSTSVAIDTVDSSNSWSSYLQPMPSVMYGQTLYGSSFMYPPVPPHVTTYTQPPQQQSVNYTPATLNTLGLNNANYENTDATADTYRQCNTAKRDDSAGDEKEKTDGESSYSSFYSSFFKTESGSVEESDVIKNVESKEHGDECMFSEADGLYTPARPNKNMPKRKVEPPWMEQVCVSSELIYKYQIVNRSREEVLAADKIRMKNMEQPMLVNEQLGQLYLELQFEGVAARLTLEEGITSSASSGEEEYRDKMTSRRRRTEYSKMTMIFEEDAPLPPPEDMPTLSTSMFTAIP